ncbi:MAG: glycoside hydrolase family 127 protein [Akkermansiaceae bacterium]|nr:glycoside hydrolase family 127 protein [Akkermansiaceae bacterium]
MTQTHLTCWLASLALSATTLHAGITVVERPDTTQTTRNYVSNRTPLKPSQFIGLPVGSVEPAGWLREFLKRQQEGLTGNLGEISAWLQKDDNAWLSKDGKGRYGWEELPYWFKGYIELAYIFKDPKMLAEVHTWVEGALASQRPDGDFGPDQHFEDGSRDYWANMIMLFCLESYYDQANDPRVLELMSRYFKYQLTVPDDQVLTHYWQKMRGGDNLYSIHWLYNRNGDPELLKLAEKIHRCTADWTQQGTLPNWHNVNIAQCFREPAQFYLQSHNPADLKATYDDFLEVRKRYGQVPGGMFGGDENCRPGYADPRQAVETCGMVEQMLSDEMLMQITGDPFWGDHCEEVAFNSYPAAVMPDFKSLRYLTAPNMVVSDSKNHAPGVQNSGPFMTMNPFSSRCCQHNHSHGWPYFSKSLWMATPDNGVCAAIYSASSVNVKVAGGIEVGFTEKTNYPFEDTIDFSFSSPTPVEFPLYLRIPAWCQAPQITINGEVVPVEAASGRFVRIDREWKSGDTVSLKLPMEVALKTWDENHGCVSVNYGPLTFSLKIGERYDIQDSTQTAIGDSSWQQGADPSKWPSYEIHPTTPWNYGLVLNPQNPADSFTVKPGKWPADNFPFKTDSAPIIIEAKAKKIPAWSLDRHGLCAVLQDSPVVSGEPLETVTLIPMGAARLRISAFPVIGEGAGAHEWVAPPKPNPSNFKVSASHCFSEDSVDAPADGLVPASSNDHSVPRLTWWDHRGTTEWVQFDFDHARQVSSVAVYWFDDTGEGQCRVPKSWRLLYRTAAEWKPVPGANSSKAEKDQWNQLKFKPLNTSALRLEVELQPGFSGGILEWSVK